MPEAQVAAGDLEHLLTLNLTEGVGVVLYRRLLRHFGTLADTMKAPERALREVPGIGPVLARAIREQARRGVAAREIETAARHGILIRPFWDADYPALLKPLYDPPLVLYIRGTLDSGDAISLAMVGTRAPTWYGRAQTERFARLLAARDIAVTSGLARGIDTIAHETTLQAGGRTIAVIGSGLRNIYPSENARLADRVGSEGALCSEFCLHASPNPRNFPRRNRIISGLSRGVLVVEAGSRSGALITADWALEQGREVFAIPGRIDSPQSAGCHALLKQGAAKLVASVEDILEEFPDIRKRTGCDRGKTPDRTAASGPLPGGSVREDERILINLLGDEPCHIDRLIAESRLPSPSVASTLLGLELKRLVRQLPGKYFVRR